MDTRELRDLQMMVEGYRTQALAFEAEVDHKGWQLRTAEDLIEKQDKKIQCLLRIIALQEQELVAIDSVEGSV